MKFLLSIFRNKSVNIIKKCPHSIFTLFLIISLFLVSANVANAQCSSCNTTYTDETINSTISLSGTVCFTGTSNTVQGDISSIADGTIICVSPGTTLNLNSNNYNNIAGSITVNVSGTLKFNTNPNLAGKWTFNILSGGTLNYGSLGFNSTTGNLTINNQGTFSGGKLEITGASSTGSITNTGAMTLNDDLNFAGSTFTFYNNSPTTLDLKTIALSNSLSKFTFTNYTKMNVSSTLNLNNGTGQFKNLGTLTVSQNYNSSSTSTYVNCGTYNGKFNLNGGGELINTGTFTTSQIDYGGSKSRIENYGYFNVTGNINLGGKGSVFYNEGITSLVSDPNSLGQFQSDGNIKGPSDATKKGYFIWSSSKKANMNSDSIGPNLNFSTSPGNGSAIDMFNNPGALTWLSNITWGLTEPTTLPSTDCPEPDGKPAVPVPLSTSVCSGINLTSLQPSYTNISYEWWTGTSTMRATKITSSTTPSINSYTTAGPVYLWAKNVSSGEYSASGAAVTVNADPTVTISPSSSSIFAGATVTLTATVNNGVGTVTGYQWMSGTTSGGTYSAISGATGSTYNPPTLTIGTMYYKVTVTQSGGGCDGTSGAASVEVKNSPPAAVNDINTTYTNKSLSGQVLTNDSDPEGDVLTVTTQTNAATPHGTVTVYSNGTYAYTPADGYTGTDTFSYQVCDNGIPSQCSIASVTINVVHLTNPLTNDPPVANNDTYTVEQTQTATVKILGNDSDPDGNTITVTTATGLNSSGGSITLTTSAQNVYNASQTLAGTALLDATGNIVFVPAAGYTGNVPFNYTISDGNGGTASASALVTVLPANATNDVNANDDANTAPAGTTMTGNILTNDTDPEKNTFIVTTATANGTTLNIGNATTIPGVGTLTMSSDGSYTFVPVAGYTGTVNVPYTICDNGTSPACDQATLYLTSLNSGVKVWTGNTSTDFNTNSNWSMGVIPVNGDDIVFATVANYGSTAANNLVLPVNTEIIIHNLTNASDKALIIPAESGLIVDGTVSGFETSADKLQLLAEAEKANGTFIALNNCGTTILGTVQLYAKGKKGSPVTWTDNIEGSPTKGQEFTSSYQWQFFGVPVETVKASPTFDGSFLRRYNETINNTTGNNGLGSYYFKWEKLNNASDLTAFGGYEITQDYPTIYSIKGKLQLCDHTIKLQRTAVEVPGSTDTNEANKRYGLGQNIFGNSFTAAIPVKDLTFPADVEKTVYLYNTGSFAEWTSGNISENTTTAGAYLSIPYNTSSALDVQIPSMQGFLLLHTGSYGTTIDMNLPYAKLTKNLKPQTAPRAALSYLQVELESKTTRDKLWLFSQNGTTSGFDNGWDGRKFFGTPTAFIYTENADGPMQVNTDKTIDGSVLCFYANDDTDYMLKLTKSNLTDYPDLKLIDLVTRTVIPLTGDITMYRFTADNKGSVLRRFIVVNSAFVDFNSEKFKYLDGYLINNKRLIINNLTPQDGTLHLYDISGRTILSRNISPAVTEISVQLPTGIYLLRLQSGGKSETIKLMIK